MNLAMGTHLYIWQHDVSPRRLTWASSERDCGVGLSVTDVEGKEGSVRIPGWREGTELDKKGRPSPGTSGFTYLPVPRGDPGSPVAFLGRDVGREWSTEVAPWYKPTSCCGPAVSPWAGCTPFWNLSCLSL